MRLLFVLSMLAGLAAAADWPRFRGPNGSGISTEAGLPDAIGPAHNLLWRAQTPRGHSSPVVAGGRVWFTGFDGDQRTLECLDARTGKLLWRRTVEKARTEPVNPTHGPVTPTPAIGGGRVYAFFPEFGLLAWDLDGNLKWKSPLGPFGSIQGMAGSPVYAEGKVMLLADTPEEAWVAAFAADSGEMVWKAERPLGFLGSYTTPAVWEREGGAELVVAGAVELTGYRVETGEKLWWVRGVTNGPAVGPVLAGDAAFTVEPVGEGAPPFDQMLKQLDKNGNGLVELDELKGEGVNDRIMYRLFGAIDRLGGNRDGAVDREEWERSFSSDAGGGLVRTRLGGRGDVTATHIGWRHTKGLPYLTNPLVYQGLLYSVRPGGILSVFDVETGELLRQERLPEGVGDYYASPVAGDGKLYFVNKEGRVTVIRAGRDWALLGAADLGEEVIATPAIAGGRIYVRSAESLWCFGASGQGSR
jgi:outer membrane protein assembly factor BamB